MTENIKPLMLNTTTITTSVNKLVTEIVVNKITDIGDVIIDNMSFFGDAGIMVISPRTSRTEVIKFTDLEVLANGNIKLKNIERGMQGIEPYTSNTEYAKSHPVGSEVIISNTPQFFLGYLNGSGDQDYTSGVLTIKPEAELNIESTSNNPKNAMARSDIENMVDSAIATVVAGGNTSLVTSTQKAGETLVANTIIKFSTTDAKWYKASNTDTDLSVVTVFGYITEDYVLDDIMAEGVTLTGRTDKEGLTFLGNAYLGVDGTIVETGNYRIGTTNADGRFYMESEVVNQQLTDAMKGTGGLPSDTNRFVTEEGSTTHFTVSETDVSINDLVALKTDGTIAPWNGDNPTGDPTWTAEEICYDLVNNKILILNKTDTSSILIAGSFDNTGNIINFGTPITIIDSKYPSISFDQDNGKALFAYTDTANSNVGLVSIVTIETDNELTISTPVTFNSTSSSSDDTTWTKLKFNPTTGRTALIYVDTVFDASGSDYYLYGVSVEINQNAISLSDVVLVYTASATYLEIDSMDDNRLVCVFRNGDYIYSAVLTMDENSNSLSKGLLMDTAYNDDMQSIQDLVFEGNNGKIVMFYYPDRSYPEQTKIGTVSGTDITWVDGPETGTVSSSMWNPIDNYIYFVDGVSVKKMIANSDSTVTFGISQDFNIDSGKALLLFIPNSNKILKYFLRGTDFYYTTREEEQKFIGISLTDNLIGSSSNISTLGQISTKDSAELPHTKMYIKSSDLDWTNDSTDRELIAKSLGENKTMIL